MEINVGEYVRTKNGYIAKIINIIEEDYQERGNVLFELNEEVFDDTEGFEEYSNYALPDQFTKHSKNIIDLIEVGDIVHTRDVLNEDYYYIFDDEMLQATRETIESGIELLEILTHKQFEQNCYRLEDNNE